MTFDPKNIMGKYILDDKGNPVHELDLIKWGQWLEKGNRIVKQEYVGKYFVSTVFSGIDHNFSFTNNRTPILFETMVFDTSKKEKYKMGDIEYESMGKEMEQDRYATKKQALKGHEEMVKKYGKDK